MTNDHISRLARLLQAKGIQRAFGVTGGGDSLSLIHALEENGIPYFPVAHEASAALMAGACSRRGNTEAVAITIKGPGFANLVPGILSNYYECRPAVTVSEAYGDSTPAWQMHKRLDHFAVSQTIIKAYGRSSCSDEALENLIHCAGTEAPGPVHIDLCSEERADCAGRAPQQRPSNDAPVSLREVLEHIEHSFRPVVVLGALAARRLPLCSWDQAGVPVVTTAAAKGAINEHSSLAGGIITGEIKSLSPERALLEQADLVVAFGLRNSEVIKPVPFGAPLIIIDALGGTVHDGFNPALVYVNDALQEVANTVIGLLARKAWGADIVAKNRRAVEEELFRDPWLPCGVFRSMQELLGGNPVLTLDTGLFCVIGETVWKSASPEDFCSSSVGRFMGVSIPTAIGLSLSSPGKTVVCVAGDGGIRPYFPEIRLAVEEKLPILFVLLSDGGYGTIALSARSKKASPRAYNFSSPDWCRTAESLGCRAASLSSLEELQEGLKNWNRETGPLFLEMKFDREKYINSVVALR